MFTVVLAISRYAAISHIVLAVLATGEAFVVDSRPGHAYRVELCEIVYESDEDEAESSARPRCAAARGVPCPR